MADKIKNNNLCLSEADAIAFFTNGQITKNGTTYTMYDSSGNPTGNNVFIKASKVYRHNVTMVLNSSYNFLATIISHYDEALTASDIIEMLDNGEMIPCVLADTSEPGMLVGYTFYYNGTSTQITSVDGVTTDDVYEA